MLPPAWSGFRIWHGVGVLVWRLGGPRTVVVAVDVGVLGGCMCPCEVLRRCAGAGVCPRVLA